jgi:hypothetical protein
MPAGTIQFPEVINLRITAALFKAVEKMAKDEQRPIGMMARILVEEAVEQRNGGKKHAKQK